MKPEEKEQVRERILAEIERIKEELPAMQNSAKPVSPDNAIGRLTRMEAIGAQSINEAALSATKTRLDQLEMAIVRIKEDEDFGICIECDEEIALKRLLFKPEVTRCITCAQ